MTVSKSFTAVGVSDVLAVAVGETFSYAVSGTFVGSVVLERQERGRGDWKPVLSAISDAASGTILSEEGGKSYGRYRWRCSAYVSGTIVTSLADVTTEVGTVIKAPDGSAVLQATEDGPVVPSDKTLTATAIVTTALTATNPTLYRSVINKTGVSIAADALVALAGLDATSGLPKIVLADADVAAHDDVWVTTAAIADQAAGAVVRGPVLSAASLNTNSASTAGDPVYLSTTAGGFTHTAPTGATARVQPVGFVVVKSASVGQILWVISPIRAVGTNEIQAAAVTKTKLAGGFARVTVQDGENETSTHQITCSGMAAGDEVVTVLVLTTKASIATLAAHAGTLTAAANKVTPGTEVDNTGNQYIVFWADLT